MGANLNANPNPIGLDADASGSPSLTGETIDGIYDDPFGQVRVSDGEWDNYDIMVGWKIRGLSEVSFNGIGDRIYVPDTFTETGDDEVDEGQFEVYIGTYIAGIFTVTGNDDNNFTLAGATHTMILYDNEDPDLDPRDPLRLDGIVMAGVYEEEYDNSQGSWFVTGSVGNRYIYWDAIPLPP